MKGYLMKSIGRKWKDWKCEIKKQAYYPYRTDVERLAHKPNRVEESHWRVLVYYWSTQKALEKSERNKLIRSKKKFCHTIGRTSFAYVMEREKSERNKLIRSKKKFRHTIGRTSFAYKDGRLVNDVVAQALSNMDELVSQMSESSMQSSSTVDEVFTQVMGLERTGHVRTYSFGPSPRDVFGHKKSEEMQAMQSS
ncbi:unnamed protein product [Ilex paraguariensis]|uniref:Uncharacterized protein n=1 Tax=Ilex paraguariensis TaxID=185542 RepID=A0ABC8UNV3_9AQUA